jgi:hypothetical protein
MSRTLIVLIAVISIPLVSLALGATLLLRHFGSRAEPRLALVVERRRDAREHR